MTPDSRTVYAIDSATVVPVHTATGKAGKPIRTGVTFTQMVVTPDGRTGYVLGPLNTVIPIDLSTNSAEKPIIVGGRRSSPWALAITPDGKTVYVANYGNGTVVPISTATGSAGTPIKVGRRPSFVAITPNG